MDEQEYKATYQQVNPQACAFEKALLTRRCACQQAVRTRIAEREAIGCRSPQAQFNCATLLELLQQNARFALKITNTNAPLPHAKALKVQCGGLLGLQQTMRPDVMDHEKLSNVYQLISQAQATYGSLTQVPLQDIIQTIASFKVRKKTTRPST